MIARLVPLSFPVLLAASLAAHSQAPEITLHSTVSGSLDQPKVMYILPWQHPPAGLITQDVAPRIDADLFEPLDRDEFLRELSYRSSGDPGPADGLGLHTDNLSKTE